MTHNHNIPPNPGSLPTETGESASLPARSANEASNSRTDGDAGDVADEAIPAPAILFHPMAGVLPMRDVPELARHVRGDGPIDSIILYEGKILDRPDLYLACLLANREPTFETYAGNDPLRFLIDRQLHRGYPNESQRAILGARVCELPVGGNQYSEGMSIGRASDWVNVSRESISRAKKVLVRGIPELVKAVDNGTLSVWKAFRIAKLPESEQRAAVDRAAGSAPPVRNSCSLSSGEASTAQVEAPASGNAVGSVDAETPAGDAPEAGQPASESPVSMPVSTSSASVPGTTSAELLESPRGTPRHASGDWILHGYSPVSGVTAIVGSINAPTTLVAIKVAATVSANGCIGKVIWLTAQHGVGVTLRDQFTAADGVFERVHPLEAPTDHFRLPIHNLWNDLRWLDHEISSLSNARLAVVDYFSPYLACGDLEQSIRMLRPAVAEIYEIAMNHGIAVVAPCRLPCNGGSSAMMKAIDALAAFPELQSLLLVEGTDRGTIVPKKGSTGGNARTVDFRVSLKPGYFASSVPAIVLLKNGITPKSAKNWDAF